MDTTSEKFSFVQKAESFFEKILDNSKWDITSKWFTQIGPIVIAITTLVFFFIAAAFAIIFAVNVSNSQPEAWDNWIQKAFKITAAVCKFFALFILLINAIYIIKLIHMINKQLKPPNSDDNNILKNVSFPILLIIGVILFIPSSINLLLLYILYGYIKGVSTLRSTGLDNENYSELLLLIENLTPYIVVIAIVIAAIILITMRKLGIGDIIKPLIFIIASLVFLFFSTIIDKIINSIIISPINKIHNHNFDSGCENVAIVDIDYIGSIIITVFTVLLYFVIIYIYGIGAFLLSAQKTREDIYNKLCEIVFSTIRDKIIKPGEILNMSALTKQIGSKMPMEIVEPPLNNPQDLVLLNWGRTDERDLTQAELEHRQ